MSQRTSEQCPHCGRHYTEHGDLPCPDAEGPESDESCPHCKALKKAGGYCSPREAAARAKIILRMIRAKREAGFRPAVDFFDVIWPKALAALKATEQPSSNPVSVERWWNAVRFGDIWSGAIVELTWDQLTPIQQNVVHAIFMSARAADVASAIPDGDNDVR